MAEPQLFPGLHRLARRYADRLTARGRFLLGVLAAFALVGADTWRSHVFVLFACAFGLASVSAIRAVSRRPRVRLECALPQRATAGRDVAVHARVTSEAGLVRDLRLFFPGPSFGGDLRFEPAEHFLAARPDRPTEATVLMRPQSRGRYELRGPMLSPTDPLRLATGPTRSLPRQALVVYPRFYRMDVFDLPLGRRKRQIIYVVVRFRDGYPEVNPQNKSFSNLKQAGRLVEGTQGAEIDPRIAPQPGDIVVTKRRVGAFSTTDLETILRSRNISKLVLFGISTGGVVLSTVRWAADMDYSLAVVSDACADRDPEVNRVLMDKVFPRQAAVVTSREFLKAISARDIK